MRMRKGKWSKSLVGIPRKIVPRKSRIRGPLQNSRQWHVHAFSVSLCAGAIFPRLFSLDANALRCWNARSQNVFHHRDFESIPILISSPLPFHLAIFFLSSSSSSIFETLSFLLSYLFSTVLCFQASTCFDIIVNLLRARLPASFSLYNSLSSFIIFPIF